MIRELALEASARAEVFRLRHHVAELEADVLSLQADRDQRDREIADLQLDLATSRLREAPRTIQLGGTLTTPDLEALILRLSHPTL